MTEPECGEDAAADQEKADQCGESERDSPRPWYLYLIETASGALYTGITTDIERRYAQHASGKGARALRGKGPLTLRHAQVVGTQSDALKLEASIKRLSAAGKREWLARVAGESAAVIVLSP